MNSCDKASNCSLVIFQLLFFGFGFCSCLTLFPAVCGRDAHPFQLPLGDLSWQLNFQRGSGQAVLVALPYRAPQLISYFCVLPIPLLPVFCGSHALCRTWLPLALVAVCSGTHSLLSKERLVTDHIVQILSYCKASFKGGKKKALTVISLARMHADELLEKGIWQNEKQGMKGP